MSPISSPDQKAKIIPRAGRGVVFPLLGESLSHGKNDGRARRVIISAVMNGGFLPFPFHGSDFAITQVIVVRADQEILRRRFRHRIGGRQNTEHIAIRFADALDGGGQLDSHAGKDETALRMGIFAIQLRLDDFEVLPRCCRREPLRCQARSRRQGSPSRSCRHRRRSKRVHPLPASLDL